MKSSKPIIFSEAMLKTVIDNRKTQHRIPYKHPQDGSPITPSLLNNFDADTLEFVKKSMASVCPYQPGDTLWVKEAYCLGYFGSGSTAYKVDYDAHKIGDVVPKPKWSPSIHMPRSAARIFLRVTDVKVERLHEININGMVAEGVIDEKLGGQWQQLQQEYYAPYWNAANEQKGCGWVINPYTWVISFEVEK